jgi:hypothetical protein
MHALELCVAPIEALQCSHSEELTVEAEAEERDGDIEETVDVKGVDVLGRAMRIGEREVALQKLTNVLRSRVVNRDLTFGHTTNLRDQEREPNRAVTSSVSIAWPAGSPTMPT